MSDAATGRIKKTAVSETFSPLLRGENAINAEGEYYVTFDGAINGQRCTIYESFGREGLLLIKNESQSLGYKKYSSIKNTAKPSFCGFSAEKLIESGKDLIAEKLLKSGFSFKDVKGILPTEWKKSYLSLGYRTSPRLLSVNEYGEIFMQPDFDVRSPEKAAFTPAKLTPGNEGVKPDMSFIDGILPVLTLTFESGSKLTELTYLTEHADADFEYSVFVRCVTVNKSGDAKAEYYNAGVCNLNKLLPVSEEVYYDCLDGALDYYRSFIEEQAVFYTPEPELNRVFYGVMLTADNMMNGFKPKYGNMFYSLESHDNFPPNYITAIAAYAATGHPKKARLIAEHFLNNAVSTRGKIIYRQGETQFYSFSASETGQLLYVMNKYKSIIFPSKSVCQYAETLKKLGRFVLSAAETTTDGFRLIRMCAEADTNGRIYEYLQNSLWASKGLYALNELLDTEEFKEIADELKHSALAAADKYSADSPYGKLPPFQLSYTALPLTLSKCKDTTFPVSAGYLDEYLRGNENPRLDLEGDQNLLENNYANYRYYPEMLSSGYLTKAAEKALNLLRENAGGEIMCMTRFMDHLDDWPAYNNALFLLDSGRTDKFRLLSYAHILYHGLSDFHIYYEQVGITDDAMVRAADSCLPSTLLPALTLSAAFARQSLDGQRVELLKGIDKDWLKKGFYVDGIVTGSGKAGVKCEPDEKNIKLTVKLSGDFNGREIRLYLPVGMPDCASGTSIIRKSNDYVIIKPEDALLTIKNQPINI